MPREQEPLDRLLRDVTTGVHLSEDAVANILVELVSRVKRSDARVVELESKVDVLMKHHHSCSTVFGGECNCGVEQLTE